jgi:hypothetical protein
MKLARDLIQNPRRYDAHIRGISIDERVLA